MEGDLYNPKEYTVIRRGTNGLSHRHRRMHENITSCRETYEATFKIINANSKCYWKRGDIIQFDSAFHGSWKYDQQWQSWFLEKEKYFEFLKEACPRRTQVPFYAAHEYAIILNRYKWTKKKDYKTFNDYGSIIIMLTGKRVGHIRKYYINSPWRWVGSYPYDNPGVNYLKVALLVKDSWSSDLDEFIKNITEKLS